MKEREYTPAEVADLCRVKTFTVWEWIRLGKLEARRQNRAYRISESALQKFMDVQGGKNGKAI